MEKKPPASERLAGIEWMRGIAAFGVVCVHSGLVVHNDTTPASETLRHSFSFAVPFFLMVSFFFAIRAEMAKWLPWGEWLQRRTGRLLIPYVFWSAVYFALHAAKLLMHHQIDEIKGMLLDPAELILTGGTGIALYFLPMLFTGLVLTHLVAGLLKRLPLWGLAVALLVALGINECFVRYVPPYGATFPGLLESPLRLAVGLLNFGVLCAPVIFIAAILTRTLPPPGIRNAFPLLIAGLLVLVAAHLVFVPASMGYSVEGFAAFIMAWGLSGILAVNAWASLVGLFSFGVYLVHQVFLELLQVAAPFHGTMGVLGTLVVSVSVFAVSMLTVGLANRGGLFIRQVFGLK